MPGKKRSVRAQTTLRLPRKLLSEVRGVSDSHATNLNDFIITALTAYLDMLRRREIDAAFQGMAHDEAYLLEAEAISESFAASDWEALSIAEEEQGRARETR